MQYLIELNNGRKKLSELESIHINITNKLLKNLPTLDINSTIGPYKYKVKYLGIALDAKLSWKEHVKKKGAELELKYRQYLWLIRTNFNRQQ